MRHVPEVLLLLMRIEKYFMEDGSMRGWCIIRIKQSEDTDDTYIYRGYMYDSKSTFRH